MESFIYVLAFLSITIAAKFIILFVMGEMKDDVDL